mmetsp:Transcript_25357/g.58756  ORF Transcript_25357/g.58756 Transcript_25357/m.58756 type:complete len:273 (-) Transcript_25357:17-835(-)
MHKIRKLRRKLHPGGPAPDNHKVEQALALLVRLAGVGGALEGVGDGGADAARVRDLLEEVRVLLYPGRVEGVVLGTDRDDELVVGHGEVGARLCRVLDDAEGGLGGAVGEGERLVGVVHVEALGLHKLDPGEEGAHGLDNGTGLDRAHSDRGEEGGHEEVVAGRDADDLIARGVDSRQEPHRGPAGAEDYDALAPQAALLEHQVFHDLGFNSRVEDGAVDCNGGSEPKGSRGAHLERPAAEEGLLLSAAGRHVADQRTGVRPEEARIPDHHG